MSLADPISEEYVLRQAIERSNQDPIPRNIVLRICLDLPGFAPVLERLYREIELLSRLTARDREVVQLQFLGKALVSMGGATRAELLQSLTQHFSLSVSTVLGIAQLDSLAGENLPPNCDLLGLGPGAKSQFGETRTENAAAAGDYCAALDMGRLPVVSHRQAAGVD